MKSVQAKSSYSVMVKGKIHEIDFKQWMEIKGKEIKPIIPEIPIVEISVKVPEKVKVPVWIGSKACFGKPAWVKPSQFSSASIFPWIGVEKSFIGIIGKSSIKGAKCVASVVMIVKIGGIVKAIPVKDVMIFSDKMQGSDKSKFQSMKFGSQIAFKSEPVVVYKVAQKKHDISFAKVHDIKVIKP